MKNIIIYTRKFSLLLLLAFNLLLFIQCVDDDDNGNVIYQETCDDGIQNGSEQGVDCGGEFCSPCDDSGINFEGTFVQEDIAGRPAVNMIFGFSDLAQNEYNVSSVSNRSAFQEPFEIALEAYHDIYALSLDIPTEELDYETNILNWNANVFTTVLSEYDALQVAPNAPTTYLDADENMFFTGRSLSDDVMDITLKLIFGGVNGDRFDGSNDTPQLTTDAIGPGNRDFSLSFPYLEPALTLD